MIGITISNKKSYGILNNFWEGKGPGTNKLLYCCLIGHLHQIKEVQGWESPPHSTQNLSITCSQGFRRKEALGIFKRETVEFLYTHFDSFNALFGTYYDNPQKNSVKLYKYAHVLQHFYRVTWKQSEGPSRVEQLINLNYTKEQYSALKRLDYISLCFSNWTVVHDVLWNENSNFEVTCEA